MKLTTCRECRAADTTFTTTTLTTTLITCSAHKACCIIQSTRSGAKTGTAPRGQTVPRSLPIPACPRCFNVQRRPWSSTSGPRRVAPKPSVLGCMTGSAGTHPPILHPRRRAGTPGAVVSRHKRSAQATASDAGPDRSHCAPSECERLEVRSCLCLV